jgi:hypothetical protein
LEKKMKSRVIPFVVLVALLAVFLGANIAQARLYPDGKQPKPFIIKGVVTVQFEDDVDLRGLRTGFGRASFSFQSQRCPETVSVAYRETSGQLGIKGPDPVL